MNRMTKYWLLAAALLTVLSVGWVVGEWAPLGIVGEWTWRFDRSASVDRVISALIPACVLGWLCWGMGGSLSMLRQGRLWAFLVAVMMLTVWLQASFAYMGRHAFAEAVAATAIPEMNESFDEATSLISVRRLLRKSQEKDWVMQTHDQAHAPGPVLFYHLQWRMWRATPAMAERVAAKLENSLAYAPEMRLSLEEDTLGRELFPAERATLYGSMVVLWLVVALGVIPLYFWANDLFGQGAAITAVGLYPMIPSVLLFNPVIDQLYIPMALVLLGLLHWGVTYRKPVILVLAGAVLWVCLQFSLLFMAVLTVVLVSLILETAFGRRDIRTWKFFLWVVAGFAVPHLVAWVWLGYNAVTVWAIWLQGQIAYGGDQGRGYLGWLLLNPVDFILFLGIPLAVFAVRGVLVLRENWTHEGMWRFMVALFITLLVFDLTGVTRGEVARLWMFMMPLVAALAAYGIDEASDNRQPVYLICLGLLFVQAAAFRLSLTGLLSALDRIGW